MNSTENFSLPPTHNWLFSVMVMTSDRESEGCEFKYRNFCTWKERSRLISLNSKWKKHNVMHLLHLFRKTSKWVLTFYGSTTIVFCFGDDWSFSWLSGKTERLYYGAPFPSFTNIRSCQISETEKNLIRILEMIALSPVQSSAQTFIHNSILFIDASSNA